MTREIKFRVVDKISGKIFNRVWIYEDHIGIPEKEVERVFGKEDIPDYFEAGDGYLFLLDNFELIQFIGLKDKDKKMIFDGDIIEWPEYMATYIGEPPLVIAEVKWAESGWQIFHPKAIKGSNMHKIGELKAKIIGNKFENPELLESEVDKNE